MIIYNNIIIQFFFVFVLFNQISLQLLGTIFVVGIINFYLLIPTVIIGLMCYYTVNFYLSTSRSIKRLEGVSKCRIFYSQFALYTFYGVSNNELFCFPKIKYSPKSRLWIFECVASRINYYQSVWSWRHFVQRIWWTPSKGYILLYSIIKC